MYEVYCDSYLIYSQTVENLKIIQPKLDLELNKTGSFTFTIYPSHPYFDKLQKLKSTIKVLQDGEIIFRGRILNDEQGFYNEKRVVCEGELAFLIDSIQRPYDYTGAFSGISPADLFTLFIQNHNRQVSENRQFIIGEITVTCPGDCIACEDSAYLNTWDSINKKLIESLGGYLQVRHEDGGNYIDYLKDFSTLGSQTVAFGKNLLDLRKIAKGENIATAIIPLGAKFSDGFDKRLTIGEVNGGVDYVFSQEAVDRYGWIFQTITFDDVTEAATLLQKGKEYLAEAVNLTASIELTAADLSAINQDVGAFRVGTYVQVRSSPHAIAKNVLVKKLSLYLADPKSSKLTLDATYQTFTEQASSGEKKYDTFVKKVEAATNETDIKVQEISKCVRTTGDSIILGKEEDGLFLKIQNGRISFFQNGLEVAHFSSQKLYVTAGEYTNSLQLGGYAFIPQASGNLLFKGDAAFSLVDFRSTGRGIAFGKASEKDAMEVALDVDLTGKLIQEDRQVPVLQNNWVNYGAEYELATYWKDKCGVVHLGGTIKDGATASETVIFTLPDGYRPRAKETFSTVLMNGICVLDIYPTGAVTIKTGAQGDMLSLSGISFRAA